jgi:soluble cytochrome b562
VIWKIREVKDFREGNFIHAIVENVGISTRLQKGSVKSARNAMEDSKTA